MRFYFFSLLGKFTIVVQPAPPLTVKALAVQQDLLVLRISSLMTSLFELKSRLALMDDPQVSLKILFQLFGGSCLNLFPPPEYFQHHCFAATTKGSAGTYKTTQ